MANLPGLQLASIYEDVKVDKEFLAQYTKYPKHRKLVSSGCLSRYPSSLLVTSTDLPPLFGWDSVSLVQEFGPSDYHLCLFSQLPPVKKRTRGTENFLPRLILHITWLQKYPEKSGTFREKLVR